jgi:hypothetical protein
MSVTWVQTVTPWTDTSPAASGSFTPTATNTIVVFSGDRSNSGETLSFSGTGTYSIITPPGSSSDTHGETWAVGYNLSASSGSQTATITSSASGDYMVGWAFEYSGVSTIAGAFTDQTGSPITAGNPITGASVVVPSGGILLALCADVVNGSNTFTAAGSTSRGTGTNLVPFGTAEYAGAGSSIQPSFVAGTAGKFIVLQILLTPSGGSSHPSQFFLSSALAPLGALSWIIGRRNKLAGVRRSWRQDQKSRLFLPEYKRAA